MSRWVTLRGSLGDAYVSLGDAYVSLGDAYVSLGDAYGSLGDVYLLLRHVRRATRRPNLLLQLTHLEAGVERGGTGLFSTSSSCAGSACRSLYALALKFPPSLAHTHAWCERMGSSCAVFFT
jgi:hypothetical protein